MEGRTTLAAWAGEWLILNRLDYKPKTIVGYESLLRRNILPEFGQSLLEGIRRRAVIHWIYEMRQAGANNSAIRQSAILLAALMQAAMDCELVDSNPAPI